MIWADRIAIVLMIPYVLAAIFIGPQPLTPFVPGVTFLWIMMRGIDFVATGKIRRNHSVRSRLKKAMRNNSSWKEYSTDYGKHNLYDVVGYPTNDIQTAARPEVPRISYH